MNNLLILLVYMLDHASSGLVDCFFSKKEKKNGYLLSWGAHPLEHLQQLQQIFVLFGE